MDKKIVIIIASAVIIASGVVIMSKVNKLYLPKTSVAPVDNQKTTPNSVPTNVASGQKEVSGKVLSIGEKNIFIGKADGSEEKININGKTPVTKIENGKSVPSGLYEIKVTQTVKVGYDGATNEAIAITIEK